MTALFVHNGQLYSHSGMPNPQPNSLKTLPTTFAPPTCSCVVSALLKDPGFQVVRPVVASIGQQQEAHHQPQQ